MGDCNLVHVPMEPRLKLSKESSNQPVDATFYRSIVGSLRYLVHTRPDITFAVGYVSRFMENPTTEHMAVVKHLLRYIAGTRNYGCRYVKDGNGGKLIGYSDADMASDIDDRKSTSGMLFMIGHNPVTEAEGGRTFILQGGVHCCDNRGLPRSLARPTSW